MRLGIFFLDNLFCAARLRSYQPCSGLELKFLQATPPSQNPTTYLTIVSMFHIHLFAADKDQKQYNYLSFSLEIEKMRDFYCVTYYISHS